MTWPEALVISVACMSAAVLVLAGAVAWAVHRTDARTQAAARRLREPGRRHV